MPERKPRRALAALVVLVAALALLWWTSDRGDDPLHQVDSDVRACKDNLKAIYQGLREYDDRLGNAPEGSGVAFFAALVADGIWEDTRSNARLLTCPGDGAHPVPADVVLSDLPSLTPAASAYAGRDTARHPLERFPSGGPDVQVLIACDNAGRANHDGATNVLLSDGTIRTYMTDQLKEQGVLPADATYLPVGPESPIEDLRVLVPDR